MLKFLMKCTWYRLLCRLCNLSILASFSNKPFDEVTDGYGQPVNITKSCRFSSTYGILKLFMGKVRFGDKNFPLFSAPS